MPKTNLGKWSVSLIGSFIVLILIFYGFIIAGQRGGQGFFDNLYLAIPGVLAGACCVAAFVIGIIAIAKQKERSALVYIAVVIGALVTFFIGAEILFPH